jgi:hypothetical protein
MDEVSLALLVVLGSVGHGPQSDWRGAEEAEEAEEVYMGIYMGI